MNTWPGPVYNNNIKDVIRREKSLVDYNKKVEGSS